MKWDAVEREFVVISHQLLGLSRSFGALAHELHRERESARMAHTRTSDGHEAKQVVEPAGEGTQPALPFPGGIP